MIFPKRKYKKSEELFKKCDVATPNFTTPILTQNTTYYAKDIGGTPFFGGPLDNSIGGGGLISGMAYVLRKYNPTKHKKPATFGVARHPEAISPKTCH